MLLIHLEGGTSWGLSLRLSRKSYIVHSGHRRNSVSPLLWNDFHSTNESSDPETGPVNSSNPLEISFSDPSVPNETLHIIPITGASLGIAPSFDNEPMAICLRLCGLYGTAIQRAELPLVTADCLLRKIERHTRHALRILSPIPTSPR